MFGRSRVYHSVAGKSVSRHPSDSTWGRSERQQVCGDTGIMEMGWGTAVYGDPGVPEMGCSTGSIFLGDPRLDRYYFIAYHLIQQGITHSIFPIF